MTPPRSLAHEIKAHIVDSGPIGIERYMALVLGHPSLGYYTTRDPFGAAGDFITAPEISQMFGELVGLWAASVWAAMGSPASVRLVELGPGRGTLMADALRAASVVPQFRQALHVELVDTSPRLREAQAKTLASTDIRIAWHGDLDEVEPGPMLLIANEFFDALPIRQYVRTQRGWCERLVGIADGELTLGTAADPELSITVEAPDGSVLEVSLAGRRIASAIGARVRRDGGAALIIDYGYAGPRLGDSLQAVKAHRYVDPLADPGDADVTAHVDFTALAKAARAAGADVHGPVMQSAFLDALGIRARAETLRRRASPVQTEAIDRALERLTLLGTPGEPGMGRLFKALAIIAPGLPVPPGFVSGPETA